MRIFLVIVSLLFASSSFAMRAQQSYTEAVLDQFQNGMKGTLSDNEQRVVMRLMNELSYIPLKESAPLAIPTLNLETKLDALTNEELESTLLYMTSICLTNGKLLQIYEKCTDNALTQQLDSYSQAHMGENPKIDVLVENFFSLQFAMQTVREPL